MTSSRRDFIATVLGAPLALACREERDPLPGGELLLPGKALGHRLRDTLSANGGAASRVLDASAGASERAQVVIVGGGASGLSAAWWLQKHGIHDVLVLELDADGAGGTARAAASAVTPYPWGAHYIVAPQSTQPALIQLLDELGAMEDSRLHEPLVAEHAACREPEERIFYHGRWYEGLYLNAGASRRDLEQLERFRSEIARWVGFRDAAGRRAFALPASAASNAPEVTELDRLSFSSWLDARGITSRRLRWLADYACRDDYGLLAADTSAWAGVAYFAARIRHPGDEAQAVVTWPEGNGRLVRHMARALGPRLRLGHAVSAVRPEGAEVALAVWTPDGARALRAEHVIMATPQFITEHIVSGLGRGARPRAARDRGAWAVANLHLDGRPRTRGGDAALAWDNVIYDSQSLGYVVATHQSGRDHGPTVFTWYYPFTGDAARARAELDGASREDWAAAALADIARAHPDIAKSCRRIDVAYWGHGMARPRPGHVFDPALSMARQPLGSIHFAGSELSGFSLFEEALDHGVRAAAEVLEVVGRRS